MENLAYLSLVYAKGCNVLKYSRALYLSVNF